MMQYIYKFLFLIPAVLFSYYANSQSCEKLIWQDEFEENSLNLENWNYQIGNGCPELCGWGNNEQQFYTSNEENIKVEGGKLIITAREDSIGGFEYSSARITSKNKVDFRYGRIEASIKLPETQGLWPAFWMLSTDSKFGDWPRSGEIDILELLGDKPTEILGTIHTGLPWTFIVEKYSLPDSSSFADTFNLFSLEWSPDTIKWFVNDVQYHEITSDSLDPWAPFQEDFHLLLNVAVGGNLPGFTDSSTMLPQSMEVDYIRLYSKIDDLQISGKSPVMGEQGITYKTFDIEDATYEWAVPEGSTIVSGQGSNEILVNWGCSAADISLIMHTDCDTVQISYPVPSFQEKNISGLNTVSQNQTNLQFSIPITSESTYQWTVPEGVTITSGQGTNSINLDWGCNPGEISVEVDGACGQDTSRMEVSLNEYSISGFAFVQENAENQVFTIDTISNVSYSWTVPEGATIVSGQGSNEIIVDFGLEGGLVEVEVSGACGVNTYSFDVAISATSLYCDFDGKDLDFGVFGGSVFEKIPNPFIEGINLSEHVGITRKDPASVGWAGIFADLGQEINTEETDLLHLKVYSETEGIVKFKVEDQTTGVEPIELDLELPVLNEWVELVYDGSSVPSETFDRIALFFDFDDTDTSYWYFDDLLATSSPVSRIKEKQLNEIQLFPNPTQDQLNINLERWINGSKAVSIKLFDVSGQLVHKSMQDTDGGMLTLQLPKMTGGSYFIVIEHENLIYTKSFVIIE